MWPSKQSNIKHIDTIMNGYLQSNKEKEEEMMILNLSVSVDYEWRQIQHQQ